MQLGAHPLMGLRIEARERFGERTIENLLRKYRRVDAQLAREHFDAAARLHAERYVQANSAMGSAPRAEPLLAAQPPDERLHLAMLPRSEEYLVD